MSEQIKFISWYASDLDKFFHMFRKGYSDSTCFVTQRSIWIESAPVNEQTVMVVLFAVAGAVFVVLVGLFATCWAHRRNKRKKKQKESRKITDW